MCLSIFEHILSGRKGMNKWLKRMFSISAAFTVFCGFVLDLEYVKASENESLTTQDTQSDGTTKKDIAWENYAMTIYNTTDGLISNNVSSIAQTSDGIVWIGTDEGLTAYDGNEFTEYGSFYHFDGVNDMAETADGGVWFATTTYGGAVNLGSRFQHFDDVSDYASNYATSIAEGKDGYIYIGTLRNMLAINPQSGYTVVQLNGDEYYYVTSIASGNELTAAITVNGDMVFIKDAAQVGKIKLPYTGSMSLAYADGYFFVGTDDSNIVVIDEGDIDAGIKLSQNVPILDSYGNSTKINRMFFDDDKRLWVLAEGGIGYFIPAADNVADIDKALFYTCHFDGFESGFTDIMIDYQGNYWISSSKRGVLLLRKSDFTDELAQSGFDVDVINSVMENDGILYLATDSGIIAIDTLTKEKVVNEFTNSFNTGRIIDVVRLYDKKYVAVYGEGVFDESGECIVDAARINRLTVIDGKLYVLSDDGCIVWDGKSITAIYGMEDGLYNTNLTSALCGTFGKKTHSRLFLGSDGAGIYVFEDGLVEVIDENAGLPSKQVNDMAAYDNGFFIATDNGVAYYNGKKAVVPYSMPKELDGQECKYIFVRDDKLYVICKSAVFVVELDGLFDSTEQDCAVSYEKSGFSGKLTDGGHGFMDNFGKIYMSCGKRLYSYVNKDEEFDISSLKLTVQSISVDKRATEFMDNGDNTYEVNLTKDAKQIDILCSVLNFSSNDPYVRYIMPGVDNDYTTVRLSELEHIIYENLEGGSHVFWFELLGNDIDEDKNALAVQTIKLTINKEQALFEKLWFRMVMLGAAFGVLMYFVLKDRNKKNIEVDKSL